MLQFGTKANRFLEDSEFKTRKENMEIVNKKLKEMFKEICK